jgi:hypothetical protein
VANRNPDTSGLVKMPSREVSSLGGKASAKARRERKAMREMLSDVLDMPLGPGRLNSVHNLEDMEDGNITVSEGIALAMVKKALNGDVAAATFVRDSSGNKPADTSSINVAPRNDGVLAEVLAQLRE